VKSSSTWCNKLLIACCWQVPPFFTVNEQLPLTIAIVMVRHFPLRLFFYCALLDVWCTPLSVLFRQTIQQ